MRTVNAFFIFLIYTFREHILFEANFQTGDIPQRERNVLGIQVRHIESVCNDADVLERDRDDDGMPSICYVTETESLIGLRFTKHSTQARLSLHQIQCILGENANYDNLTVDWAFHCPDQPATLQLRKYSAVGRQKARRLFQKLNASIIYDEIPTSADTVVIEKQIMNKREVCKKKLAGEMARRKNNTQARASADSSLEEGELSVTRVEDASPLKAPNYPKTSTPKKYF